MGAPILRSRRPGSSETPTLSNSRIRTLLERARVARLATVGDRGPRIVPITFALIDNALVTAIDHKPKTTRALERLSDIEREPSVSVLADHYEDDWTMLWWCRADGIARIVTAGSAFDDAIDVLVAKYDQYRDARPEGPAVIVDIDRLTGWSATRR